MATQARPDLPQITRFLAGMVTNRNPIDTPFQIVGLNIVQHHDALNDGQNMEISAYNTLMRRPGFASFLSVSATPKDFFSYKDLDGNLSLFFDLNGDLYLGSTPAQPFKDSQVTNWSLVGIGNFIYASNRSTICRFNAPNLTTPFPVGIAPIQIPPTVQVNTVSTPFYMSDFIPTNDAIGGTLLVTDLSANRTLTITITNGNVHFNVTLLGLPISPDNSLTQTDTQTVAGSTTTDVITQVDGTSANVTGTGISNGIVNYYPDQGTSMMDFDYVFEGTLTLSELAGIINSVQSVAIHETGGNFSTPSLAGLDVFVSATVVAGQVASTYYPDTPAIAIVLTGNGQ